MRLDTEVIPDVTLAIPVRVWGDEGWERWRLTYLHWAWKYFMRVCRKSTPFFPLISFTLSRYCGGEGRRF